MLEMLHIVAKVTLLKGNQLSLQRAPEKCTTPAVANTYHCSVQKDDAFVLDGSH